MADKKDSPPAPQSNEEAQMQYQYLKQEYDQVAQKIAEMEGETHEHNLVLTALEPLEEDRKCFRLVGQVLVEKTAKEVVPELKQNIKNIEGVIEKLKEQAAAKNQQLKDYIDKYGVSGKQTPAAEAKAVEQKEAPKTTGVLA